MSKNDIKPIQWPSQPLPDEHINCGTDDCCGECSTSDKDEDKSISAYGHLKRRIHEQNNRQILPIKICLLL